MNFRETKMEHINIFLLFGISLFVCVQTSGRERLIYALIQRIKRQSPTGICDALTCEHGHCRENSNSVVCICDKNYTGANCNIKCTKNCGTHGKCTIVGGLEKCKCNKGYEGTNCNKKQKTKSVNKKQTGVLSLITKVRVAPLTVLRNPFKTYGPSKDCGFGFLCYNNGDCDIVSGEGSLRFKCRCKEGFIGDFCETRCDKKCKNGGFCLVERKLGKMLCGCPWPYSGHDCGIKKYPFWHESTSSSSRTVTGS